jgi:hypothetical protein
VLKSIDFIFCVVPFISLRLRTENNLYHLTHRPSDWPILLWLPWWTFLSSPFSKASLTPYPLNHDIRKCRQFNIAFHLAPHIHLSIVQPPFCPNTIPLSPHIDICIRVVSDSCLFKLFPRALSIHSLFLTLLKALSSYKTAITDFHFTC